MKFGSIRAAKNRDHDKWRTSSSDGGDATPQLVFNDVDDLNDGRCWSVQSTTGSTSSPSSCSSLNDCFEDGGAGECFVRPSGMEWEEEYGEDISEGAYRKNDVRGAPPVDDGDENVIAAGSGGLAELGAMEHVRLPPVVGEYQSRRGHRGKISAAAVAVPVSPSTRKKRTSSRKTSVRRRRRPIPRGKGVPLRSHSRVPQLTRLAKGTLIVAFALLVGLVLAFGILVLLGVSDVGLGGGGQSVNNADASGPNNSVDEGGGAWPPSASPGSGGESGDDDNDDDGNGVYYDDDQGPDKDELEALLDQLEFSFDDDDGDSDIDSTADSDSNNDEQTKDLDDDNDVMPESFASEPLASVQPTNSPSSPAKQQKKKKQEIPISSAVPTSSSTTLSPTPAPMTAPPTSAPTESFPFVFYVMGDVPYTEEEAENLIPQIKDIPSDAQFVVHVGDMNKPQDTKCHWKHFLAVKNIFLTCQYPMFILPGDNDIVDCPYVHKAWSTWVHNFRSFENNWSHPFSVRRQSTQSENFAFFRRGVLFIGVDIVLRDFLDESEQEKQIDGDLSWVLGNIVRHRNRMDGLVIFGHSHQRRRREDFFVPISEVVKILRVPTLYMHGNGHDWEYEKDVHGVKNFLRVQVDRGGRAPPVRVEFRKDATTPFEFDRRI